jgi:hypothetical protein
MELAFTGHAGQGGDRPAWFGKQPGHCATEERMRPGLHGTPYLIGGLAAVLLSPTQTYYCRAQSCAGAFSAVFERIWLR